MPVHSTSRHRALGAAVNWVKTHHAFVRVLVAARRLRSAFAKFDPNQPRAPGGRPDGGRWVWPGAGAQVGGAPGGGFSPDDPGRSQEVFTDESGTATWDLSINTYDSEGDLAAQIVVNADGTATTTEWDTSEVEPWAVRQTLTNTDRAVVTTTELARDGTGQITVGPGGGDNLVLANADTGLRLVPVDQAPPETVARVTSEGDIVKPLTDGAVRVTPGGAVAGTAAGAGAFIVGVTALAPPAGAAGNVPLSDDVRIAIRSDNPLAVVQERVDPSWTDRFTGETWRTLPGVAVTDGPGGTLMVDGDQLRSAIGQQRFDALGTLEGRGVALSMEAVPVAPRDIPADSLFQGDRPSGFQHSVPGTVVDWSAPYATADKGQQTVLELREPGMRGLAWTSGDDKPMIGPLDTRDVDRSCPRFSDVHQVAVEADARVRAANPSATSLELGRQIHAEIAGEVKKWPEIGLGVWSEQGVFMGIGQGELSVLPRGAVRYDVLEDAGRGTVCIYDPKTGETEMSRR